MVSTMVSALPPPSPPLNISTPIQMSPLIRNIMCPHLPTLSGTEVPVPWFTDIIYKTIKNFRFLKTCLTRYDVMTLHLKTFSNIL